MSPLAWNIAMLISVSRTAIGSFIFLFVIICESITEYIPIGIEGAPYEGDYDNEN